LLTLRDAVTVAAGGDFHLHTRLIEVLDRLVEPLLILQDLPGDAVDALAGSRLALDRLTTALVTFGGLQAATKKLPSAAEGVGRLGQSRETGLEFGSGGLIDHQHIAIIGLAAAYASVARPETSERIEGGLALALAALMPLDLLWAIFPSVLDGDARSARLLISLLGRLANSIISEPLSNATRGSTP
jgi:hypothetical protein